jgi:hypothetical protein
MHTMPRHRFLLAMIATSLLVAACGGSSSSSAPAATGGTPTAGTPTEVASATEEASASDGGGGGVANGDACKLLTAAEVSQATGQANVVGGDIPGENMTDAISGCAFVSGGLVPVMNVIILGGDTNKNPDDMKLLPLTEEVTLSGARAMYVPASGSVLFIYKNNKVVMVQVLMPKDNDIKATAVSVAQKIADRM